MSRTSHWQQDHKLRIAILLYHALQARAAPMPVSALGGLTEVMLSTFKGLRHWEEARERRWDVVAYRLQAQVANHLYQLQRESQNLLPFFNQRQIPEISPIRFIRQDLEWLESEFDDFQISTRPWSISCVTPDPVELEGIALGRFRMTLNVGELLRRGTQYRLFSIESLDPCPAASSSDVVHPHVRDHELCLGDALHPLKMALSQGRLFDAFTLIDRTLHTYNPHSAYVSLEEWEYQRCEDCGGEMSPDDACACSSCGSASCSECYQVCEGCREIFCRNCIKRDRNDESFCSNCRGTCRSCNHIASQKFLDEHDELCEHCWQEQEEQAANASTESEEQAA